MITSDATTFDLGQSCLRLKDALGFAIQQDRHGCWYLIEDESRGQFYRIGAAEYTFLSLLDGKTTMASAMATTCSLMGASALNEHDAINLCKWLIDSGLAHTRASTSAGRIREKQDSHATRMNQQKLNPISIRVPLIELDRFTENAEKYFGWFVNWPSAIVWTIICLYGLITMTMSWDRIGEVAVFSRDNIFWMTATWLILKTIHEFAHVLVCKRFGGKIGKGGILFLLLIPMPFVDVTSAWRFPNKYQRIFTSAAGMLAEMFLAAIAAIVWSNSGPGAISYHAANVMVAASLHTFLFNANPLMRFDGYHILADWLEIPNLGNQGQSYVNGIARKLFFGVPCRKLEYLGFHGQIIRIYGVAALLWKVCLCVVLSIAATNLFYGVGMFIAAGAIVLWLLIPVRDLVKYIMFGTEYETPNRRRFAGVTAGLMAVALAVGNFVPAPTVITAPIVIDYRPLNIVRAETVGFIETICVDDQQHVDEGDILIVLRNHELESRLARTECELAKSQMRAKSLQNRGEIGAWQAEQAVIESLTTQLSEIQLQNENLRIRATSSGQVIANQLENSAGKFVQPGTELLSIGNSDEKEAIALVSQNDARNIAGSIGQDVDLRIWGLPKLKTSVFSNVEPRTRDDLPHFAFAGVYGGTLDVVQRNQVEDAEAQSSNAELMLTQPRVVVRLTLDKATSGQLYAGQTGLAHLRGRSDSLGGYIVHNVSSWLKSHITESHGL